MKLALMVIDMQKAFYDGPSRTSMDIVSYNVLKKMVGSIRRIRE